MKLSMRAFFSSLFGRNKRSSQHPLPENRENADVTSPESIDSNPSSMSLAAPKKISEPVSQEESFSEQKKTPIPLNFVDASDGDTESDEAVSVRFRTSFESRYIQSGEVQSYYSEVKNALLAYKGVKSRISWNYDSFNKARLQCAKINVKGNALLVYLALDPKKYSVSKYHFADVGEDPKFTGVPLLMKIKSRRALKYTLELISEMMSKLEIPRNNEYTAVDYRAPYESTEQLAERGLIKVIAPVGTTLSAGATVKKVDVAAMFPEESKV